MVVDGRVKEVQMDMCMYDVVKSGGREPCLWLWLHSHLKLWSSGSLLQDKSLSSFHPVQQTIFCSGSLSRTQRIAPVQILHADTNQTNDCMQIRVSV